MGHIERLLGVVKDCLFPMFCFSCGREGEWWCAACMAKTDVRGVWACPVCHADTVGGIPCRLCAARSALSRHIAILPYKEDAPIGALVRRYKYSYAEDAFVVFDRFLSLFVREKRQIFSNIGAVVPVPLHPRRFAERGFNQAEAIAGNLSRLLHIPLALPLIRIRNTEHQARLSRIERQKNVAGAFAIRRGAPFMPKKILLVDDVFTTGSTMQECAEALRAAGAVDVAGFSVARG